MEPRTREHLAKAARNRDVALALIDPALQTGLQPQPFEWALVAAFYAAVHCVNAYIWETHRSEPANHGARRRAVAGDRALRSAHPSYAQLRHLAFTVRYNPSFYPSRAAAEYAVRNDLAQVERTVQATLRRLTS